MKKIAIFFSAVLFSTSIAAKAADLSDLALDGLNSHHKCFCNSWKAAQPTPEQNAAAGAFVEAIKTVYHEHKEAIHKAHSDVVMAWSTHPVSKAAVIASGVELKLHMTPVMESVRDNSIEMINLLSADQHTTFSATFTDCIKH